MRSKIFATVFFLLGSLASMAQSDSVPGVSKLLELSLEELMNIKVVSATGYMQTTAEAPSTITVISSRQIQERGYEQLEDALRDIPGIDMIHINGYAPTLIYFRGMYGAENLRALLMIDGIEETNIIGSNDLAGPAYSLHNVDRIEIIWGPVSALYGANAFGGVINIISKKAADINGVNVEKGFGTFNTRVDRLNMGLQKSKIEMAFAGSMYSTDGPKFTNRDPQYRASYVDKAYSINTYISYIAKNIKTTLGYRDSKSPTGWGTYSNSPTVYLRLPSQGNNNNGTLGILERDIRGEKSGLAVSFKRAFYLQNEFTPNDKLKINIAVIYRETGTGTNSYLYVTTDGTKLIRVLVATYSNRLSGDIVANYSIASNQKLSAGIEYYRDNVEKGSRKTTFDPTVHLIDGRDTVINLNSAFLPRQYDIRKNFGGYLQYVLNSKLLGKTNFTFGARYDHNTYFGEALSPRIAIVNQPNSALTFKLQFGTAFRAPTNIEIYQTPGGNFQLKKEQIRTYEVNTIYTFSKNVRAQINLFRNELTDVIILGNLSGLNPDKNPGEQTTNGLESTLDLIFSKQVSAFVNFTYQDATAKNYITNFSGQIAGVAKIKGNAGITFHVQDMFTVTATGNWVGKRRVPTTNPNGPVPGYFLSHFTISTGKLFNKGITASLHVQNIFNIKWLDPGVRTADGFLYATVLEQPGTTALFKIGISL